MKITEVYEELRSTGIGYFTVSYELSHFTDSLEEIDCCIYCKGIGHFKAPTFALALDKVRESMGKIKPDSLDDGGE